MYTLRLIKLITRLLTISLFCMLFFIPAYSGEVTYPNDPYTSGDPLTAADLNAKFNEIKADVNDNNTNITALEAGALRNKINIDFGTFGGIPTAAFGSVADQVGEWNQVGLGTTALTDLGGLTGVSIDVTADSGAGELGCGTTSGTQLLLCDNFFSAANITWSISITGLLKGAYVLYLYAPSNSVVSTGAMSINNSLVASITGDSSHNLIEGTSYLTALVIISSGNLTISGSDANFSGLSGLQIVPL